MPDFGLFAAEGEAFELEFLAELDDFLDQAGAGVFVGADDDGYVLELFDGVALDDLHLAEQGGAEFSEVG